MRRNRLLNKNRKGYRPVDVGSVWMNAQLSDAGGGQTELSFMITQSGVPESFKMRLPLCAVINGETQYIGLVGATGNMPIQGSTRLPVRPAKILLDPNRSILAEIDQ
jgi:hypothetical protein